MDQPSLREPISDLLMIETDPNDIRKIHSPTSDEQFLAVTNNPESIQHIRQPLIAVQELAVQLDPTTIKYFWKHATHNVREKALQLDATVIQYLLDSTLAEQKYAIRQDRENLYLIPNRTWKTDLWWMIFWYKVILF